MEKEERVTRRKNEERSDKQEGEKEQLNSPSKLLNQHCSLPANVTIALVIV